jgi:hypothetical protein
MLYDIEITMISGWGERGADRGPSREEAEQKVIQALVCHPALRMPVSRVSSARVIPKSPAPRQVAMEME